MTGVGEGVRTTSTVAAKIHRRGTARLEERNDTLATEEPLEIRILSGPRERRSETTLGITMRTPGNDLELVAGLLLSEGIVNGRSDLERVEPVLEGNRPDPNLLRAQLAPGKAFDAVRAERKLLTTSACGICGSASLDALALRGLPHVRGKSPQVSDASLRSLPAALRNAQRVFQETGGLHAAALFEPSGRLVSLREDVGRHNAVDKLLGAEFLENRLPRSGAVMLVSGRASYEIMQKALAGGVPFVAAVGAPSSLAVDLASEFGQTLVGFLRSDGYNAYANPQRIVF